MKDVILSLLSLSIGGSIIALGLLLLRRCIPNRLPKSFFYYAWLLVLLRLALPIPGFLVLPQAPTAQVAQVSPAGPSSEIFLTVPEPEQHPISQAPVMAPVTQAPAPSREGPVSLSSQKPAKNAPSPWAWAMLVWALGMLGTMGRELTLYFRFRRKLRRTLLPPREADLAVYAPLAGSHHPRLRRSRAVDTPMLMGILRPLLVLPDQDYAPQPLTCIFLHELTHYRRFDIGYKWFTMPVLAVHWFNPLTIVIRREIDRCCELSCDEMLLKAMDHDQRRRYGETLLALAAGRIFSGSSLSTTFAAEKKNLKERLVHIMKFSPRSKKAILSAVILLILIALCCLVFGPGRSAREGDAIVVKSVDGLLNAIDSDTHIILEPGVYDLTQAAGYGKEQAEHYLWEECFDGRELILRNVRNLTISGRDGAQIITTPRYAAVLGLRNCSNITIEGITAGHSEGPGSCVGAVISMRYCSAVTIQDCVLYGCGTLGVEGFDSRDVDVNRCIIKECSLGGTSFRDCESIQIRQSQFFDCGTEEYAAYRMFAFNQCSNCAVFNCEIFCNRANELMQTITCRDIRFLGNRIGTEDKGNVFLVSLFNVNGIAPTVDGCGFLNTQYPAMVSSLYDGIGYVFSPSGEKRTDVADMVYEQSDFVLPPKAASAPEQQGSTFLRLGFHSGDETLFYDGGEARIGFDVQASQDLWDTGIGLLLLLDGQPQPYKIAEDGEYAYLHSLSFPDNKNLNLIFTPVTGKSGDQLDLTVINIKGPEDYRNTATPFNHMDAAMPLSRQLVFRADPPEAVLPDLGDRLISANLSAQESHGDTPRFRFHWPECTADLLSFRGEVYAPGEARWTFVAYLNNQPVSVIRNPTFSVQPGQAAILDLNLDITGLPPDSMAYGVLVCTNPWDSSVLDAGCSTQVTNTLYLSRQASGSPRVVEVSTLDEFLGAIGPDTTVVLAEGTYDLDPALDSRSEVSAYYSWNRTNDGFQLQIRDVSNFHIVGAGKGKTVFTTAPRYNDVLWFSDCENISVTGITAGHTIEPGYCTGGVLRFDFCQGVGVDSCGLYGCGIYGIIGSESRDLTVRDTEIYECSDGAVDLFHCDNASFENCDIHDCPQPYFGNLPMCKNITFNEKLISAE